MHSYTHTRALAGTHTHLFTRMLTRSHRTAHMFTQVEYCETWTPYTYWIKELKEVVVHGKQYGDSYSQGQPAGVYYSIPPPPLSPTVPVYSLLFLSCARTHFVS